MRIRVGTFNLFNLVKVGEPYYSKPAYSQEEFDKKADWIRMQLRRMECNIVGFQEVFHEEALEEVVKCSGLFTGGCVAAPGADGSGPMVGLATSLPVVGEIQQFRDFPDELDFSIDDITIPIRKFGRPVLKAVLQINDDQNIAVFVAHLKSKRPIVSEDKEHDPKERAIGKARSLIVRAAESAALRSILVDEMKSTRMPVIVVGDLNDSVGAVTTDIVSGSPPWRFLPRAQKEEIWDVLLYSAYSIQARQSYRDVGFSHIHNGRYESLDHIFVSEEFYVYNSDRIGAVEYLHFFNDHLADDTVSSDRPTRIKSDHGQLVATIRMR
jgi:hypothetical protein